MHPVGDVLKVPHEQCTCRLMISASLQGTKELDVRGSGPKESPFEFRESLGGFAVTERGGIFQKHEKWIAELSYRYEKYFRTQGLAALLPLSRVLVGSS